jgi:DNA-binding MurR/RpiR family transcriptional regulator
VVDTLERATRVFVCGFGVDGGVARDFALKLSLLGKFALHVPDPVPLLVHVGSAGRDDALVMFSEHGDHAGLSQLGRQFQAGGGRLVSVTRHTANPLRAHADLALLVSAHAPLVQVETLLYRAALQHLLDVVFLLLCERCGDAQARFETQFERIRHLLDP